MKIFCPISMYTLEQSILIFDNDQIVAKFDVPTLDDLSAIIIQKCKQYGTNHIVLSGNTRYCDGLVDDILKYNSYHYNLEDLEIEVCQE